MRTHDHRTQRRQAPATGLMHKLFARPTRLPATVSMQEQDWDHDVPTVKLSTAFMVILFLHVAVVGGVMLFYFLQRDPGTPVVAMPEPVPPAAVTMAGAPATIENGSSSCRAVSLTRSASAAIRREAQRRSACCT